MGNFIDITGNQYGELKVIGISERKSGRIYWKCKCECGNVISVYGGNLKNGHTSSCGCKRHNSPKNLKNLIGKRFGRLVVAEKGSGRFTAGGTYKCTWICHCDCGNTTEVDAEKLTTNHTTSCGCKKKEFRNSNFKDLIGRKFARLTVIRYLSEDERKTKQYNWLCRCDCGKEVRANASNLKTGRQQSCGCLKEEMKPRLGEITRKYKYSNKRLYNVYKGMISRCSDELHREWKNYGGRGITVCDEWMDSYDCFAEWALKTGYDMHAKQGECTLERKNIDLGYSPGNCCWITNKKQQNNRRDTIFLEHNGEKRSLSEWSDILNIPYTKVYYYCRKRGKTIEELLNMYG